LREPTRDNPEESGAVEIAETPMILGCDSQVFLGVSSKSTPARTRTLDPLIKSQLLYRLSYEGLLPL
jgi:hypothetical protein